MVIDGLFILRDFVSADEESKLVSAIGKADRAPGPERNRIERYGPGVVASGYSSGTLISSAIPPHLSMLCDRLISGRIGDVIMPRLAWTRPNAITVNEYLSGQQLGLHTDLDKAGDEIFTLGVLGDADMVFQQGKYDPINILHPRRALMRMRWPCRYPPWRHGVLPVPMDRISIVFRYGQIE